MYRSFIELEYRVKFYTEIILRNTLTYIGGKFEERLYDLSVVHTLKCRLSLSLSLSLSVLLRWGSRDDEMGREKRETLSLCAWYKLRNDARMASANGRRKRERA